jgi:probable HAF family extracellular repeat protein
VVVGSSLSSQDYEAFRWEEGVMIGLGELGGAFLFSEAYSVSADGSVVVGNSYSSRGEEAFRWEAGSMRGLGDLPGGQFASQASDVSADGRVVVGASFSSRGVEAFRWEIGSMWGLGDLPGGDFASGAFSVSGDGSVVAGISESALGIEAFVWTETAGMRPLYAVLAEQGAEPVGWRLGRSWISSDGLHLAGIGINPDGNQEAWVAYVPEPSQGLAGCLALAAVALCGRARRRFRSPAR